MRGEIDFPLYRAKSGQVTYRRAKSTQVTIPFSQVADKLIPSLHDVKELCMTPRGGDTHILERVLDVQMSRLGCLRIDWDDLNRFPIRERAPSPPRYTLRATTYPKLHTLRISAAFLDIHPSLYQQLRFLHLEAGSDATTPPLPLADFLQMLRQCAKLEQLFVWGYIDVVEARVGAPPLSPVRLADCTPALTDLTLTHEPRTVSIILSHLVIPKHVRVIANVLADENPHSVIRDTVPYNLQNLEIVGHAAELTVKQREHVCLFSGTPEGGDSFGCFDIDLILHEEWPYDNTFIHTMVQALPIFSGSPLKTIEISGDLKPIPPETWIPMLDRFSKTVEVLNIESTDSRHGAPAPPNGLLETLAMGSRVLRSAVCPYLRRLVLTVDVGDASAPFINMLYRCLADRVKLGCWPLRELVLTLYVDRDWYGASNAQYQARLASVVGGPVTITLWPQQG